jgi:hypothetical protein
MSEIKNPLQIDADADMDRFYIPVNSHYEVQTKGKGSSFRIANTETHERFLVTDERLHAMLEDLARVTNAELRAHEWVSPDIKPPTTLKGEDDWKYYQSEKLFIYSPLFGRVIGYFEFSDTFKHWRLDDENDLYEIEGVTGWMHLPPEPIVRGR